MDFWIFDVIAPPRASREIARSGRGGVEENSSDSDLIRDNTRTRKCAFFCPFFSQIS
jgi:hypothetical protein